ncbi:MAG: PEP-CTERM sorting domain-containing protein [Bryobacterales bacterium]|nr:PEP-CTERM sorting domain-containing protein [Bryobacterales bacterium]
MRLIVLTSMMALTVHAASFMHVNNGVWSSGFSTAGTLLAANVPATVDPHFRLLSTPAGCAGPTCTQDGGAPFGTNSYVVQDPGGQYPFNGTWLSNNANSLWLGPRSNQFNPQVWGTAPNVEVFASSTDFYVYRMVFNFSALALLHNTANIQLAWLSDNSSTTDGLLQSHIRLCGIAAATDPVCSASTAIGSSSNTGQNSLSLTPVSIVHGANNANFSSGLNALDFIVYNQVIPFGGNPSGMRVHLLSADADPNPTPPIPEPASLLLISTGLIVAGLYRRRTTC